MSSANEINDKICKRQFTSRNLSKWMSSANEINDKICKRQYEVMKEVETDKENMKKI